jgi:hypothetical protein
MSALLTGLQAAIDGSKFKAATSKDSVPSWRSCAKSLHSVLGCKLPMNYKKEP